MRLFKIKICGLPMVIAFLGIVGLFVITMCLVKSGSPVYQKPIALPSKAAIIKEAEQKLPAAAQITTYQVVAGDTLGSIAFQHQIDVATLRAANPGLQEEIHIGDELTILPQNGVLHTADRGDTLWTIANLYGVDIKTILEANGKQAENLGIGEEIFIPGGKMLRNETPVSRAAVNRFLWPTEGDISSDFGYRWGRLHAGIDIANDSGTAVKASRSGLVSFAGWNDSYGYMVKIDHGQGYTALYAHLSDYTVVPGQEVALGQVIGYMGSTGNSTGPHLHFEVHKDGYLINPLNLLP